MLSGRVRAAELKGSGAQENVPVAMFVAAAVLLGWIVPGAATAATLSDPQVDRFNARVGTQTFSGLYQFTTNNLLVETAQAMLGMGSDTIKMYMGPNYPGKYYTNLPPSVTSLMTLAKNEPNCRAVLNMPFHNIISWAYPLSNPDAPFLDGNYTSTEANNDYREMYDLTRYLLTNYNNAGKTFYLGHWEGDGYLDVNNWTTNPPPGVPPAMAAWLNNRQKAIDDAKAATTFSNVNVFGYAEVNRVRDAMINGPTNNVRVINSVIPYVTNLDYLSYSSYDAMNLSTADLYATLDYIEAHIPTNKAGLIPGERLFIGEYGWGGNSSDAQEPLNRAYIQRLLNYSNKALPFILFWEIYNNETNRNFWLIDSNNVKVASYYLHQRFINSARLFAAQFKETNGRLPNDSEFVGFISPLLNQQLPPPVNLSISNAGVALSTNGSASVAGRLAQGVYGDDCAAVSVYFGTQDGGAVRSAWANTQFIGINTNFNPATFTALLTNLAPNTNYYFRFYATNSSGEVWAPASSQFSTQLLNPGSFGSRMKISFSGYNRAETLPNFPALIQLSTNLPGFSYAQFASPSGGDLRFTAADAVTPLLYEIDEWNTNGTSLVWVRVPQLSGTNDFVWAYWGNPLATNPPASSGNGGVWSADHLAVWHLKESSFPYIDSSQQHLISSGLAPVSTTGFIGKGETFNGTSQFLNAGAIDLGAAFTLSAWVKLDPTATNIQTVLANKTGGWNSDGFALFINSYQTADQKIILETGDGTTGTTASSGVGAFPFGRWHRVTASIDRVGGVARIYVDGSDVTQGSAVQTDMQYAGAVNLARFTNGGATYLKGALDEVRIEPGPRSANWIWATAMTAASNGNFQHYEPVIRQVPLLSVETSGNGLNLSWPATAVGYDLYSTTDLNPPIHWSFATNRPVLLNSNWVTGVTNITNQGVFYRLQAQ